MGDQSVNTMRASTFGRGLEGFGWSDPRGAPTPPRGLDAVVALMADLDPSPADPTPPSERFGRFAGLVCLLALGAGMLTWHVV